MTPRPFISGFQTVTFGLFLLVAIAIAPPSLAQKDTSVGKTPTPDWVIDRPIPTDLPDRVREGRDGLSLLLQDSQVHWQEDGYAVFSRNVYQIRGRTALKNASRVFTAFNPEQSELNFHRIRIIRNGEIIDQLDDLEISVIRRESGLESGVWTGVLTAVAELKDVRVGDIVDFSRTHTVTNDLYGGLFSDQIAVRMARPIGQRHYRLIWPSEEPLQARSINTNDRLTITQKPDFTIYTWEQTDPDPIEAEAATPPGYFDAGLITISSLNSWAEVVDWALPLFDIDLSLSTDFAAKVDEIAEKWSKPEDRITEALRLVQDSIRYVSVAIGNGAIIPRSPKEVIEDGYGDCKDKSMLLVAALERMGIEAVPVLANNIQGGGLDQLLPSPNVFNHMIVQVTLDGKRFWLEPTLTRQGGRLPNIAVPTYGYVLPIREGQDSLVRIQPPQFDEPRIRNVRAYEVNETGEPAMKLSADLTYSGYVADSLRNTWDGVPKEKIAESLMQDISAEHPGIEETAPMTMQDDRDANRIHLAAVYEMDRNAFEEAGYDTSLDISANTLAALLPTASSSDRNAPLFIPLTNVEETIRVQAKNRELPAPEDITETAGPVTYTRNSQADGDAITTTYHLKTTKQWVPTEKAASVLAVADTVSESTELSFNLQSAPAPMHVSFHVEEAALAPYKDRFSEVMEIVSPPNDRESFQKAQSLITELTAEVERPSKLAGLFDSYRGAILLSLGRPRQAKAAYETAVQHYSDMPSHLATLAYLRASFQEVVGAARMLKRLATLHPDYVEQVQKQLIDSIVDTLSFDIGSEEREIALFEMSLAFARAGYELDPPTDNGRAMLQRAISGLVERDEITEARALLPKVDDTEYLFSMMIDRRYEAVWPMLEKRAGRDLSIVIQAQAEAAKAQYEEDPNNFVKLRRYLWAAKRAGSPGDVLPIVAETLTGPDRIQSEGMDGFRLLIGYAEVLADVGRTEEAVAQYDILTEFDPSIHNPQLIRLLINRAAFLLRNDRFREALFAANVLNDKHGDDISEQAWMWIQSIRTCALHELGRRREAREALPDIEGTIARNRRAQLLALACLNRLDQMKNRLIEVLEDPDTRQIALRGFQDYQVSSPFNGMRRKLHQRFEEVRSRPTVQAKVKEAGRIIPVAGQFIDWQNY